MNKHKMHVLDIAMVIFSGGLTFAVASSLFWLISLNVERNKLKETAMSAVSRTNEVIAYAEGALRAISNAQYVPCSPEHIARMSALTVGTLTVEEIGYFEGGLLKCTSWGKIDTAIQRVGTDFLTTNGIGVTLRAMSPARHYPPMMALQLKAYTALINPARLVDVPVEKYMGLTIVDQAGRIASPLNDTSDKRVTLPFSRFWDNISISADASAGDWVAIATAPNKRVYERMRAWSPFALAMETLMVVLVCWFVFRALKKRFSPINALTRAINNHEFVVHYQPIIELKTGLCIGAEALVRWRQPNGAMVPPDLFIPLAEKSGLIGPITDQVLATIVGQARKLLVSERALHIAINICAADIQSGRILQVLEATLLNTGINNEQIWLEATEYGFADINEAHTTIALARKRGHPVAIDDFGTGYSSLQYIQGVPVDTLKMDKSFVDTIDMVAPDSSIASHIIDIAKTLNLAVVAEGVERKAQLQVLISQGVQFGQGWLFSKALPYEEFVRFYHARQAPSGAR